MRKVILKPSSSDEKRSVFQGIDDQVIIKERWLTGVLTTAERDARSDCGLRVQDPPFFKYIGIQELLGLLNELVEVDPELIGLLCGPGGQFGYDSPKFVEAVLRLARGHTAHLARHPIVRFDEDVEPNAESLTLVLAEYERAIKHKPYYFFSGAYGTRGQGDDPINDHAVRCHWFAPLGTKSGPGGPQPALGPGPLRLMRHFLSDLNELGATQYCDSQPYYSRALRQLLLNGRQMNRPRRSSPQVISGAGSSA